MSPISHKPDVGRMRSAAELVYRMIELRSLIDEDLFADPAWSMLLDLYISRDGPPLSVMDICVDTKTSPATGVRYIRLLEERRLIERTTDPTDKRRSHVALSAEGLQRIETLIARSLEWIDKHRVAGRP